MFVYYFSRIYEPGFSCVEILLTSYLSNDKDMNHTLFTVSGSIEETCVDGSYDIKVIIDEDAGNGQCACPDWIGSDCCHGNCQRISVLFYVTYVNVAILNKYRQGKSTLIL